MIRRLLLAAAAVTAMASVAHAQPMPAPDSHTGEFITKAATSDEFERREGRLAEERAAAPMVRDFAQHMVVAHTQTTEGLKAAIREAGMTPPPPPALTDDQLKMIADLQSRHGGNFDRAYMDQQVHAHEMALQLMQGYAAAGHPGPIRDAAAKTAPLVQQHLDMARKVRGQVS